jgi:dihydrofolate synthase/folylpolyglutamate synthase
MIRDLLLAHGLRVGTFTSPHLERIEERFTIDDRDLDEQGLVDAVADVAPFVARYENDHDTTVTYFELTTAVAFAAFQAEGVDVAVVEVGLGGRLDATNVVKADVSVITGIAIDHTAYLGGTIALIAAEKVAVLKNGGILVSGRLPAAAEGPVTARVSETGSRWYRSGEHFDVRNEDLAIGGWLADIRGLHAGYEEVYLPLHGRHQVDHLATAIAATEAFFDRALDPEAVIDAAGTATSPGRLEAVGTRPLVLLDGAHNEEGMGGLAQALDNEFPYTRRIAVVGFRGDRDPAELLGHLAGMVDEVIVTEAGDGEAVPGPEVAAAAADVFGPDVAVETVIPVARAVTTALARSAPDDMVVITGSLYVVGEARRGLVDEP